MKVFLYIFFLVFVELSCVYGQSSSFGTLSMEAHVLSPIEVDEAFHEYWSNDFGLNFRLATPYTIGSLVAGVEWHDYESLNVDIPAFTTYYVYTGFAYDWWISEKLAWYNLGKFGVDRISFSEVAFGQEKNEQEFSAGFESGMKLQINKKIACTVLANYRRMFSRNRISLLHFNIGLTYTLKNPPIFKSILE